MVSERESEYNFRVFNSYFYFEVYILDTSGIYSVSEKILYQNYIQDICIINIKCPNQGKN